MKEKIGKYFHLIYLPSFKTNINRQDVDKEEKRVINLFWEKAQKLLSNFYAIQYVG